MKTLWSWLMRLWSRARHTRDVSPTEMAGARICKAIGINPATTRKITITVDADDVIKVYVEGTVAASDQIARLVDAAKVLHEKRLRDGEEVLRILPTPEEGCPGPVRG